MAENQTKPTGASVERYLAAIADDSRRGDCEKLAKLMARVTKEKPAMWGPAIVGFGSFHYRYESGREGDAPLAAFSSRKTDITVYLTTEVLHDKAHLARLGKCKTGKVCLYIKRLADVDLDVLERMVAESARHPSACG